MNDPTPARHRGGVVIDVYVTTRADQIDRAYSVAPSEPDTEENS